MGILVAFILYLYLSMLLINVGGIPMYVGMLMLALFGGFCAVQLMAILIDNK